MEVMALMQRPQVLSLSDASKHEVVVIGAGCIGLTTAWALAAEGFKVTVIGKFLPGDTDVLYASNWAGACWSPKADSEEERALLAVSYKELTKLALTELSSGVCIVRAHEVYDDDPTKADSKELWFADLVRGFRTNNVAQHSKFSYSCDYDTPVVNPQIYLPWLKSRFERQGGRVLRQELQSIDQVFRAFPHSSVVINASGVGSRTLGGVEDKRSFPDRGQNTLVASNNTSVLHFRQGKEFTYIIPRPNSKLLVCGGIHQPWNVSPTPDLDVANDQVRRVHELAPGLVGKNPEIVGYAVGVRPGREGGYRMEVQLYTHQGRSKNVLHAYGHGHNGYSMSYGTAVFMVQQVDRIIGGQPPASMLSARSRL